MAEQELIVTGKQSVEQPPTLDITNALAERIAALEARVQASTDLTDDLVAQANTVVTAVGDRAAEGMQHADLVLSSMDSIVTFYLFAMTAIVTLAGVAIGIFYSRDKKKTLSKAVDEVTQKLSDNEIFRQEFVAQMVKHPNLRKNLSDAIDQLAAQHLRSSAGSKSNPDISEDIT